MRQFTDRTGEIHFTKEEASKIFNNARDKEISSLTEKYKKYLHTKVYNYLLEYKSNI